MSELVLKNVNKVYPNGFHAVYDFNLEIKHGEFIVFVGPSGCGKSTTLQMLAGLEDITSGELLIDGEYSNEKTPRGRGVAMVFQSYALYPNMTVYENMAFGLTLRGIDEDIIEKRVNATAQILGLTEYLDKKPRHLSGGQCQRVAVGRAIIRHVDIFLMDEPLSNLDAKQRVTMRSEIVQIHREVGATTIYVTHDQTEAMTMADRIVCMRDGRIMQTGTPKELYSNPANLFVAGFIGEPPMNFCRARVESGRVTLVETDAVLPLRARCEDCEAVLGFRPEAVVPGKGEGLTLGALVDLTELLGDCANIYAGLGEEKIILRSDPHFLPKADSLYEFTVPSEALYLFDKATEERITLE